MPDPVRFYNERYANIMSLNGFDHRHLAPGLRVRRAAGAEADRSARGTADDAGIDRPEWGGEKHADQGVARPARADTRDDPDRRITSQGSHRARGCRRISAAESAPRDEYAAK